MSDGRDESVTGDGGRDGLATAAAAAVCVGGVRLRKLIEMTKVAAMETVWPVLLLLLFVSVGADRQRSPRAECEGGDGAV